MKLTEEIYKEKEGRIGEEKSQKPKERTFNSGSIQEAKIRTEKTPKIGIGNLCE